MNPFRKSTTVPPPAAPGTGPAISLTKVEQTAPGLVSLAKTAAVSLEKSGLTGQRAAVYLVLDHSGSMRPFYRDGSVQHLADQALGLSVNLDDDGVVPVVFFDTYARPAVDFDLTNYAGRVDAVHQLLGRMGSTDYTAAMGAVIQHYENTAASASRAPAFVIFQTDGNPDSKAEAETALREASSLPLFWSFVGFGGRVSFLEKLDDLRGRKVDNASFFHAAHPQQVTDTDLYDGLTREYGAWLTDAHAAGILR